MHIFTSIQILFLKLLTFGFSLSPYVFDALLIYNLCMAYFVAFILIKNVSTTAFSLF